MKRYSVTTKDGFDHRFSSEEAFNRAVKLYQDNGSVMIDGRLIEKHHFPSFGTTGEDTLLTLADGVFNEEPIPENTEERVWKVEVLKANAQRLKAGLPKLSYWHYRAAAAIAGDWDITHTLEVLETESAQDLEVAAALAKTNHEQTYIPEHKRGCGRCDDGWIITPDNKARPCGCVEAVNEHFTAAVAEMRKQGVA